MNDDKTLIDTVADIIAVLLATFSIAYLGKLTFNYSVAQYFRLPDGRYTIQL